MSYPYTVLFCKSGCTGHKIDIYRLRYHNYELECCTDSDVSYHYYITFCKAGCCGHKKDDEVCIEPKVYYDTCKYGSGCRYSGDGNVKTCFLCRYKFCDYHIIKHDHRHINGWSIA